MAGKFVMTKTNNGHLVVNLKAGNGEVILTSEFYKSKAEANAGVAEVRSSAKNDAQFDRRTSKANEPFFSLKGADGSYIGKSEMYSSDSGMENGIKSVRNNAPDASFVDETGY